jgi:cobalt/nickel transport system permease protein
MHIPSSMLHGAVCPVTMVVGATGVGLAAYWAHKANEKPSAGKFSAVTALIFAMQMLNYPVQSGTSGHLVGAMLAVSLLGIPFAVLSMALILAVQAIFFADGGVNALGANILNMGLIGAGVAGFFFERLKERGFSKSLALGIAAWASVVMGAAACSFEVASTGAVGIEKALPAMLGVHSLIGAGEALLTVLAVAVLASSERFLKRNERAFTFSNLVLAAVAAALSPFASNFPDGLERIAEKLAFAKFSSEIFPAFFADYHATFIQNEVLATSVAGVIGVGLVFVTAFVVGKMIQPERLKTV